jgi:integrase
MEPYPLTKRNLINEKKLLASIRNNSFSESKKSVPNPSAQTTIPCVSRNEVNSFNHFLNIALTDTKAQNKYLYRILLVMSIYGLRISEILNIKYTDITHDGLIKLKALKGSESRIIVVTEIKDYLLKCKSNGNDPFTQFNRFHIYRQFKKYNLIFNSNKSSHLSVTHSLRHIAIAKLRLEGMSENEIAQFTGHKNVKNLRYYGNPIKR